MTGLAARIGRGVLVAAVATTVALAAGHVAVGFATHRTPPPIPEIALDLRDVAGVRIAGRGWSALHGELRVVRLEGSPEEIGAEHATLLRDLMLENEEVLWDGLREVLPFAPARTLLFDMGRVRYRNVESGFPEPRRRELASEARAFAPDPFADRMPTYARMVMLHALYDIALGFERSPLLAGCTAFGLGPGATTDGHALFARAFDFELADVFDEHKAVFLVREEGRIPFASVAWPGFLGVVTGMNAEGVGIAVHGGRAREPRSDGVPVAFSMREALSAARDADEAASLLARQPVMVSHIAFVGDARGRFLVVERAPGVPAHVRSGEVSPGRAAVTNHFEGPLAGDPKDAAVRASTTTLARRARLDALLRGVEDGGGDVPRAIAMLRDHGCAGATCALGDRRAIDAFIATHGIVADLTARVMWVSEGPRLSGRFVKIDVGELVSPGHAPGITAELETFPADPALGDGRYAEGRRRAGGPLVGRKGAP